MSFENVMYLLICVESNLSIMRSNRIDNKWHQMQNQIHSLVPSKNLAHVETMADALVPVAEDDAEREPGHQFLLSTCPILVLDRVAGHLSPVAFRGPTRIIFWDLSHLFDNLARAGEHMSPHKMIQLMVGLCRENDALSVNDLHYRSAKNSRTDSIDTDSVCVLGSGMG